MEGQHINMAAVRCFLDQLFLETNETCQEKKVTLPECTLRCKRNGKSRK